MSQTCGVVRDIRLHIATGMIPLGTAQKAMDYFKQEKPCLTRN